MSAYLSFYKDKELKEHVLTVSRVNSLSEITVTSVSVGMPKYIDNKFVSIGIEFNSSMIDIMYSYLNNEISSNEKLIALSLIKRDYNQVELKDDLDILYELIETRGKIQVLSELLTDNNGILYTTYA